MHNARSHAPSRWHALMPRLLTGLAFASAVLIAVPATAQRAPAAPSQQAQEPVQVELVQKKVVSQAGVEKLVDATTVQPGDVIEYRATYKNRSEKVVRGLRADLPLPEGLEYIPRSARPASATMAFAKDGAFAAEPLYRGGDKGVKVAVPYSEYRMVRWTLGDLAPGATMVVSARAKVENAAEQIRLQESAPASNTAPAR